MDRTLPTHHNMIAYLEETAEAEGLTQMISFLNVTTLRYALTVKPIVYQSFVKQFWASAKVVSRDNVQQIKANVGGQNVVITESLIRQTLGFDDEGGMESLESKKLFKRLKDIGYQGIHTNLKFQKAFFPPNGIF